MNELKIVGLPPKDAPMDLEDESLSVGKISLDELREDPDIVGKKIQAKVTAILEKYGYTIVVTDFQYSNGQALANIGFIKNPEAAFLGE